MFLLDTNACIALLNDSSVRLVERLRGRHPSEIRMSSVVRAELLFGARKSSRVSENLQTIKTLFAPFHTLPFDDLCAEHYGSIRADLEARGCPIGPNDLLIAATARCHELTLVTRNRNEFSRVVGLPIEDWESDHGVP